jgi:hypothetical protein
LRKLIHFNFYSHHEKEKEIPRLESFVPAAFMAYTDIQTLRGLNAPIDYGSGIEYASGLLQEQVSPVADTALQIGLWLNGTDGCRDIVEGRLHDKIQALVRYIGSKDDCRAQAVFLRVGYEFDNPGFRYADDPAVFREAFRVLVSACRNHKGCRRKTVFVWHSWGAGLPYETTLADFYPGDEYVDWVGVSVFQQFYANKAGGGILSNVEAVLEFAKEHDKPTMIAESTPFGGINSLHDPWNDWFQPCLDLIENFDIAMWSYINCDWDSQPMWRNVGFGDTRLSINATVMSDWNTKVLQNPRFLGSGSLHRANSRHHSSSSSPVFGAHLTLTGAPRQLTPSMYWSGAILIALAALCFRCWCAPSASDANGYASLADDGENDEDDFPVVEENRTGYGSLGVEESLTGYGTLE